MGARKLAPFITNQKKNKKKLDAYWFYFVYYSINNKRYI